MDALFMNSENSKTSDPCMLVLNLTNKIILKRSNRTLASLNLGICYTWKNTKK